jgi:ABC-type sugar transport system ATPase subunit
VRLSGVSKRFGEVEAVKSLNLTVEDGEFVSLLGPSGCGKTTTLRIVAGLESPTAGDIYLDGRNVTHLSPSDRNVSMVFQLYALYPYLNVRENIAFPLRAQRMPSHEIAKRVASVAELLGIEGMLDRRASGLHPADGQRVAIAKAIVRDPSVFLFDEPLSHLDAPMRARMRSELKHLHRGIHKTMVFVTHDQIEAMALSDRIAVMRRGEIVQVGSPDDVFYRPTERYVAEFIGTPRIAVVPAELVDEPGGRRVVLGDARLDVGARVERLTARNLCVGIRPRFTALEPVSNGEPQPDAIDGVVEIVEPLGRDSLYHVRLTNGAVVRSLAPHGVRIGDGTRVRVRFDVDRLLFFHRDTGIALT